MWLYSPLIERERNTPQADPSCKLLVWPLFNLKNLPLRCFFSPPIQWWELFKKRLLSFGFQLTFSSSQKQIFFFSFFFQGSSSTCHSTHCVNYVYNHSMASYSIRQHFQVVSVKKIKKNWTSWSLYYRPISRHIERYTFFRRKPTAKNRSILRIGKHFLLLL